MVARYSGATWYPTNNGVGGSNNGPVSCSWHGAITNGTGVGIAGWNLSDYSHCHGFVEKAGAAYQYVDFNYYVAGTLDGNYRGVITWETWDGLSPATATYNDVNRGVWTDQQCERIADIVAFNENELGIPAQRMHSTRSSGNGPHGTGIPNRSSLQGLSVYEGPDRWSVDDHKPCPGDLRIRQLYGPNLDGGAGSILARGRVIAEGVRAGRFGYLPVGDVNLRSALARGGAPVEFDVLAWISDPGYV